MLKTVLIALTIFGLVMSLGDFESPAYQKQTRQNKLSQIWKATTANTKSSSFPSTLSLAGIFVESMSPSVDRVADSMPKGRSKLVHSVGSVVTAAFTPEANCTYSGFFAGADSLVIRMSLAKEPTYTNPAASAAYNNFAPGFAVKYLIDGQPAANIFAMPGVNGINSFNYLSEDFNTHIPAAEGTAVRLLAAKFSQGTDIVQNLGLKEAAAFTQDGKAVGSLSFPWKLTFRATEAAKSLFTDDYTEDYSVTLASIPVGTALFDVLAVDNPVENCLRKVGTITTTAKYTTSLFGDEVLFFQHPDFHNDLQVHPEWTPYTPFWNTFGSKVPKKAEGKCPFADLFN